MKNLMLFILLFLATLTQANDLNDFVGTWTVKTAEAGLNSVEITRIGSSSSTLSVKFKARSEKMIPYTFTKNASVVFDQDQNRYLYVSIIKNETQVEYRIYRTHEFLRIGKSVKKPNARTQKKTYTMTKQVVLNGLAISQATYQGTFQQQGRVSGIIQGPKVEAKKVTMVLTHTKSNKIFFGDVQSDKSYSINNLPAGNYTLEVFGGDLKYNPSFLKKNLYLSDRSGWNKTIHVELTKPQNNSPKPIPGNVCISYTVLSLQTLNSIKLDLIHTESKTVFTANNQGKTYRFNNIPAGTYEVHGNCGKCELISDPLGKGRIITVRSGETLVLDLSSKPAN